MIGSGERRGVRFGVFDGPAVDKGGLESVPVATALRVRKHCSADINGHHTDVAVRDAAALDLVIGPSAVLIRVCLPVFFLEERLVFI